MRLKTQLVFLFLSLFFVLTAFTTQRAIAQGAHCPATTCSQAQRGCFRRCPTRTVRCEQHCNGEFARCMQTGDFFGIFCTKHRLIKE
jgi:hypothetical protein